METTHSHHLEIHSNSVLSNIRPEIKIATTFIIVLSIAFLSLEKNLAIVVQTFVVLLLLYLSKIKISTYFKRLSIDIPFVLFALFLPFLSKGDSTVMFEFFSLPIYETGFNEMISILSFAIRYIDVFIDEFKRVKVAMKSRGYDQKGLRGLKPIAYASGAMLIRGYERGERVYNSMISRGFNGSIELKKREFKKSSLLYYLSFISIATTIMERFLI